MIFFYNGKKPSKGYDVAIGCLMVIAFSAMIYFFTRFDNLEDLNEYTFQLVFILLMAGSILYQVFRKKGKLHPFYFVLKSTLKKIQKYQLLILYKQ